jgi:hypothetical protein
MNVEKNVCDDDGNVVKGPTIRLTGDEVALAIVTWLEKVHDVHIRGPRTIMVNDDLCDHGVVYVDPSGYVIANARREAALPARKSAPHGAV